MTTDKKKFHQALREYNQPALDGEQLDYLAKGYNQRMNDFRRRQRNLGRKPLPRVSVGLLDSDEINAVAIKYSDEFFVGFYAGLYGHLPALLFAMMSEPSVLPTLGGGVAAENAGRSRFLSGPNRGLVLPISDSRERFAALLLNLLLILISTHEEEHVIGGHLDFLENQDYPGYLLSRWSSSTNLPTAGVYRFLEAEADARAIGALCAYLRTSSDHQEDDTLLSVGFVICLFTRIFGSAYDSRQSELQRHPPFFFRRFMMCTLALRYLLRDTSRITESNGFRSVMEEADAHAINALRIVIARNTPIVGLRYTPDLSDGGMDDNAICIDMLAEMEYTQDKWRSQLDAYTYR